MLRIRKAQNDELAKRTFRLRLYRFLRKVLPPDFRGRVGSLEDVSALWAQVPWIEDAKEHDLAVYLTFVWLATFDPEAARRMVPPGEALRSYDAVFAMKLYMVDAGLFDINAFDIRAS
jgi:hypothetical protein